MMSEGYQEVVKGKNVNAMIDINMKSFPKLPGAAKKNVNVFEALSEEVSTDAGDDCDCACDDNESACETRTGESVVESQAEMSKPRKLACPRSKKWNKLA